MATDNANLVNRLQAGADIGALNLPATQLAPIPSKKLPQPRVKVAQATQAPPPQTCQQTLTLSFFFDGTGNNLDADLGTWEHSNVARLYRAHMLDDESVGRFRFYLAGIGTLFKDREVNDPGGTLFGRAFGSQGQARLDFAFARLREKVKQAEARAQNPTNALCWIKVSAFGFSRGAALARAFCRDLERRCSKDASSPTGWRLTEGGHPIELAFLGLFDTVASAGLPPSSNNLRRNHYVQALGWVVNPLGSTVRAAFGTPELKRLAFGQPGADPAPGTFDGHADWANGMKVASMVKRCVHLMAAHEIRNSFALDSTLYETAPNSLHFKFPATVQEHFCPGVHSDVGGGYRPGEGGCRTEPGAQLSLIPLRIMHAAALEHVPLVPLSALQPPEQKDFAIDETSAPHFEHMLDLYQTYTARAAATQVPHADTRNGFGVQINAHMRLYYAWRFHVIRLKLQAGQSGQSTDQEQRVAAHEQQFKADRDAIAREKRQAGQELYQARNREQQTSTALANARIAQSRFGLPVDPALVQKNEAARRVTEQKQVAYDRVRARLDTAANDSELSAAADKYGRMLLADARQIIQWMAEDNRLILRPHYAALIEAYRDEFERGKGLDARADAKLIELFDNYVHDSLAGFDLDETWPSDPRIVYVGGDNKLRYAFEPLPQDGTSQTMAA